MKYETFYDLFVEHGFKYETTDGAADVYLRDGKSYRFCFACGLIYEGQNRTFFGTIRFPRTIQLAKDILIKYFQDEKKKIEASPAQS